jgi:hypothetical protein
MSTLLEQASLVMIPSGYKEDVVYSQIPTSGAGDLSFTRASNGTRINSAGLVEVCPWNLVEQSETFSNAIWNLYGSTITSNSQTAPNGTLTADTLNATTQQYSGIYQSLGTLPTNAYSYSIYVKAGTNNFFGMVGQGSGSQIAIFNLSTGVVTSTSNLDSASIENVGNGWYRCQIQKTGAGVEMLIFSSNIANSTPTASGTVFIWGAQFNIGSTAKPYFPTTDRLNVPRLTYQNGGGGCPSLLLEKQSTNLVTYSEQFDNGAWSKSGVTVTANDTTSPDGTQNADKVVENTANSSHGCYQGATVTNGIPYTWSGFIKAGERTKVRLYAESSSAPYVSFNLSDGTITNTSGSITGSIENFGNGWYRCIATTTTTGTTAYFNINALDASGNISYTGDGTSGFYIWGAQIEASSYPTSYIPTTSSSATRVADACFKTGISSLIGQTEGTLFFELQRNDTDNDTRLQISDGTSNNWLFVSIETGLNTRAYCNVGGVNQFSAYGSVVSNSTHKVAFAYKSNDFKVYIDGVAVITQTSGSVPACNQLDVGSGAPNGSVLSTSLIKEVILFPTRLTNAELASLTTI